MPIPNGTPHHNKIYDYLKEAGFTNPDKLQDADKIALAVKLSKGVVANLLLDLEKKGFVKRVARGKAAGYYVTQIVTDQPKAAAPGEANFSAEDFF
jgi:DNA-binding IscR family transcriptional regulator